MEQDRINLVPFNCPVCAGLLEHERDGLYRCQIGHVYSLQELIALQEQAIEKIMWTLYRSMTQRTDMLTQLVQQDPGLSSWVEQQTVESRATQAMVLGLLQMYK